jgi:type VI secretion system secreted protein VgrG
MNHRGNFCQRPRDFDGNRSKLPGLFNMRKNVIVLGGLLLAGLLPQTHASVDLGSAASFAVLGDSTVTSSGNTVLNGNLGVYPGTVISGFGPGVVNGTTYDNGAVAQQAASDALAAYVAMVGESPVQDLSGQDLGGLSLTPGVYEFSSSAQLTGQLTLNAQGDPNAQFIFQIGSTLTTATAASMILENGARAGNVFWDVGSSATIGSYSDISGSILAYQDITLVTGAGLEGNAIALNGAITMDDNNITVDAIPEPNTCLPVVLGVVFLVGGRGFMKWRSSAREIPRLGLLRV